MWGCTAGILQKDQLELYPYNQIETSQAFNTEADVTLALNGLYSGLRGMYAGDVANIMGDVLADNIIINQQGRLTLKLLANGFIPAKALTVHFLTTAIP